MAQTTMAAGQSAGRLWFAWSGVLAGIRLSLPLGLSTFAYGIAFGVLSRQAGLTVAESMLMSSFVFAGASQFAVMGVWATPLPVATIILTTLIVNLRHLLMGAALAPYYAGLSPLTRYLSVFFLTDENWALTMAEYGRGNRNGALLLGSGLTLMVAWSGATLTGQLVGAVIDDPARWGLDFAFSAVFLALLVGMWRGKTDLLPWLVAAVVAVVAQRLLPGTTWYIVLGGLAGSLVGALRHGR
jgi:4-azaleucine resistance transporter AzlC